LIGANSVTLKKSEIEFEDIQKKIEEYEVDSPIIPYVSEEGFWNLKSGRYRKNLRFVNTNDGLKIDFSGTYGSNLLEEIYNYAAVARIIAEQTEFDLIHAHDWLAYPAGIAAKEVSGKPLVIHVHATDFDRSGEDVNPKVYAIEREGMEIADKIISVSDYTKSIVTDKYKIPQEKVTTIYNAVEPALAQEGKAFKRKGNEKLVTFLGRITRQKGPEYFIEAANLVLKKMKNVRFVMAGSGDMMNAMIAQTAELGISDKFHFTGFLSGNDVTEMFNLTDVFVMPSVSEPFGIVPLEAMQSRVPVIISNQSGVSEILEHALKIDFWDTQAMADSIYGLLNYPSISQLFKEEGKVEVDNLRWVNSAKNVSDVYNSLLSN